MAQRQEVLLDALDHRAQVKLGILEERQQELERTVAGAAAEPGDGGVQPIGADDERLDGVGVGQLHVVVGVDADLLARAFQAAEEAHHDVVDLLGVERAVAVHDVDRIDRALGEPRPARPRARDPGPWRWP